MKLYYSPGACSLAPHIVAEEAGIPLQLEKVDIRAKLTQGGRSFLEINPKGSVPALELDDGEILTEGPVVSQYIADQKPNARLVAPAGTMERYRTQEMLGYINSELHKAYGPLFNPLLGDSRREEQIALISKKYLYIEYQLSHAEFLVGNRFSVADAYLFTITQWATPMKIDLGGYPALLTYQKRISKRSAVQSAINAEGPRG